jgi:rod shape-determining protein MreC
MIEFVARLKNSLVLILVLLVQIVMLAVQVRRSPELDSPDSQGILLLRAWSNAAVSPIERLSSYAGHGVGGAWGRYIALWHVRRDNDDLRKQVAQLRLEQVALSEDALEGKRLEKLLDFRQQYIASTVAAQVIGTSGSDRSRILLLDKGYNEGLRPDMAVMTPDGVVGKLRDVFPHTSQLLLLSDQSAGAGVLLESSRIRSVLRGSADGHIVINSLTADSRIKPGEHVLTSGGDQVFPRGLPVGTIASIVPDPDHQPYTLITITPAAKLTQLEEVLVITGTQSTMPTQTQQDLDSAVEEKRAADLAAERLPSLHPATSPDDKAEGAADATTLSPDTKAADAAKANPGGTVPKPLPTEHPDRYTPGTTPPATSLSPGAPNIVAAPPEIANPSVSAPSSTAPSAATPQHAAPARHASSPQTQSVPQTRPATQNPPAPQPEVPQL